MAIHKLADGPIALSVTECSSVEGKYGTQIRFTGQDLSSNEETLLYISERSAVAQLERLGLNVDSAAGESLHFEHVQKDGRTYTNIVRVTGDAPAPVAKPRAAATPVKSAQSMADVYSECMDIALKMVPVIEGNAEVRVSSSDIVAMAATLFIQANKR